MPVIEKVEIIFVQLPTRRVHKWAGLTEPIGRYPLVKLTDNEGRVGWGETAALKDWGGEFGRYFGESILTTQLIVDKYLAPSVRGLELGNASELHARMDAVVKGYPYAKAAVDFAYYDLSARWLNVPVHVLLGGRSRATVPVTHSIGILTAQEAAEEAERVAAEGIRTIKVKIGVDPARDIEVVGAVRRAAGAINICVDANEGYRTPGEAICTIRKMEKYDLLYVEQPVMGIERLAEVARAIDLPVMADESAWNAHDVIQIIERGAAQIVSIYTTKSGGLYKAMEVGAVCRAAGIVCNVNGSIETGVGNLANVQLAAASPAVTMSNVIPISTRADQRTNHVGGIYYTDDLLKTSMSIENGGIKVPSGIGMGIDVDEEQIKKYSISMH